MLTFATVCSGIEAASAAWAPLGWRALWFSEIEPAPIAVLKARHRCWDARFGGDLAHPKTVRPALFGDFSALRVRHFARLGLRALPDILAGGTPCQAFSVAGKRRSLADARGNLTLSFVRLAHALDNERARRGLPGLVLVWENVPGVLSTADNAFGHFLAGLAGADAPLVCPRERGRWPNAGLVAGPKVQLAWRILDAQYFGLAQRRKRVVLVASFRNRLCPGTVLFEPQGVHGDFAPRGETQQDLAGALDASARGACENDARNGRLLAHALKAEGFDASEDGTGRGVPLVPALSSALQRGRRLDGESETLIPTAFAIQAGALRENPASGPNGLGVQSEQAFTIEARSEVQCVAFTAKDFGGDATEELSPPLRAGGHDGSHANAGVMPAVCFNLRGREGGANVELAEHASLRAAPGGSSRSFVQQESLAVRRLTPRECERLMGFPDDYTLVPHRNKPMADGPRYKMLGNSWAVPLFAWLGARIDAALRSSEPMQ